VTRPGSGLVRLLADRGVPERASRLYVAACREGPLPASELARIAGINRVEAYRHIEHLHEAGLLRPVSGRPQRFAALPPKDLVDRWIRTTQEDLRRLENGREQILQEIQDGLAGLEPEDGRKFAVLEKREVVRNLLRRRIGVATREVFLCVPAVTLARLVDAGLDRELKNARERGVRIRVITEVSAGNLIDVKHFLAFSDVRHIRNGMATRALVLDRNEALVYVTGDSVPSPDNNGSMVALWTTDAGFLRSTLQQFRQLWGHSVPAEQQIVDLEEPDATSLSILLGREIESFNRLREITQLGMQVGALRELPIDLPDYIETVARQVGHEIARNLEGGLPSEIARSLQEYYRIKGLGFDVVTTEPLAIRIERCSACDGASPEVGRLLCPAIVRTIFETRTGGRWDVTRAEARQKGETGHRFILRPV
jgi:sugar-specific transcriptional regulator TrmB/predicted hydrocarbon binding protein